MNYKKIIFFTLFLFVPSTFFASVAQTKKFVASLTTKKKNGVKLSPTEALFVKYSLFNADALKKYSCNWTYLIPKIGSVETNMAAQGYTTFFHARRWEWNFLNDIWNMISAIKHKQKVMSDTVSLRQRDGDCDIQELYEMRRDLVANGAWCDSATDETGKSSELTFMNRTIFSNWNCYLECTGQYLLENVSIADEDLALEIAIQLLKKHGLQKYIKAVKALYQEHKKLTDKGELLCICVKNNVVNDMVYTAAPFGYKYDCGAHSDAALSNVAYLEKSVEKNKKFFDDGYSGCKLFCAACTDIPGEYGKAYTIKSIHFANQKAYKEYKNKIQELFTKIKKDIGGIYV